MPDYRGKSTPQHLYGFRGTETAVKLQALSASPSLVRAMSLRRPTCAGLVRGIPTREYHEVLPKTAETLGFRAAGELAGNGGHPRTDATVTGAALGSGLDDGDLYRRCLESPPHRWAAGALGIRGYPRRDDSLNKKEKVA